MVIVWHIRGCLLVTNVFLAFDHSLRCNRICLDESYCPSDPIQKVDAQALCTCHLIFVYAGCRFYACAV